MSPAQEIARARYQMARRDMARTEPETLAYAAAECSADLARDTYYTLKMEAHSATRRSRQ